VRYVFGKHELDVDRLELRRGGVHVPMEPQTFDVLTYLVRHRDRVVPKEELMDEVWGGRFVSETAVTSRIKQARRALGDDGQAQGFIRTHHGRGYRFVAEVTEGQTAPRRSPPPPTADVELPVLTVTSADGVPLRYHLAGQGPPDVVLLEAPGRDLLGDWSDPMRGTYLRGLAVMGRLIRHERRAVDVETALHDLVAVLDDAACAQAVLVGEGAGGPVAILAAATHAERFPRLVLWATYAEGAEPEVDVRPLLPGVPGLGSGPTVQLWPHRHGTDAMFLALLRRS
jgi:DNA-binding winged helix-turn-helix (wHTH) protein